MNMGDLMGSKPGAVVFAVFLAVLFCVVIGFILRYVYKEAQKSKERDGVKEKDLEYANEAKKILELNNSLVLSRLPSTSNINGTNKSGIINGVDQTSINHVTITDNNNHPIQPEDRRIQQHTERGDLLRSWKYSISKPVIIGRNVWIGVNSRINKGVKKGISFNYDRPKTHNRRSVRKVFRIKR